MQIFVLSICNNWEGWTSLRAAYTTMELAEEAKQIAEENLSINSIEEGTHYHIDMVEVKDHID